MPFVEWRYITMNEYEIEQFENALPEIQSLIEQKEFGRHRKYLINIHLMIMQSGIIIMLN